METIINYLDNMFINLPQTPEVLRAKDDLSEMMEDKYNELMSEGKMQNEAIGIVISEFGNIQELIDELGISENIADQKFSDEDFIKKPGREQTTNTYDKRHVSDLEADEYLFTVKQSAGKIASGVFLCICSPILIILLAGMQSFVPSMTDGMVTGIGMTVLLSMVACAVGLIISASMKMEPYEYLKKECFVLNPEYEQKIYYIWESQKKSFTAKTIAGVILCIISVIPLIFVSSVISENSENEFPILLCVASLLVTVGIGVFLFITTGMEEESYKIILQEKEFSEKKKSGKKVEEMISAVYWPIMVIIYLVWSFTSKSWGITWVIWPFAGIVFSFICNIVNNE